MSSTVRLYNLDYSLAHEFDLAETLTSDQGTISLPVDHAAAKWLGSIPNGPKPRGAHAVIDSESGRWSGRLHGFEVRYLEPDNSPVLISRWDV